MGAAGWRLRAPGWLHDVLGEEPSLGEVAATVGFAAATATFALAFADPPVAGWRLGAAWLLLADIAAGCVANFTASTNDFYAARPRNRWAFIAVHAHLPVFVWLVGASASSAWFAAGLWLATLASAAVVNVLAGRERQVMVAGLLLSMGLVWAAAMPVSAVVRVAAVLFLTKVSFSFAVDHYRHAPRHDDGVQPLDPRAHDEAVTVIARAFVADPLFVATCGDDPRRRRALASSLLDMTRLTGGSVRARWSAGRLVAVSLVERPARARARGVDVFGLLRFVPTLFSLGLPASRALNEYFLATRAALPDDVAYLTLLAVAPDAQGQGLGRQLVDDAVVISRSWSARALTLDTENPSNVALYERCGFAVERELALAVGKVVVMARAVN